MEDVDPIEIDLLAREHGVRAGVMPERPIMIRQLQHDGVRSRCSCCCRDVLQVNFTLGEQATDDLAQRIVADPPADPGWYSCRSESKAGIGDASAEGELRRAN